MSNPRKKLLDACAQLFGLEHPTTVTAYTISKRYPDDMEFIAVMFDYLFESIVDTESEDPDEVPKEPADIDDDTNYDPYMGQMSIDDTMEEGW